MPKDSKTIIITAAVLGALAVIVGAFGAHGLQTLLIENNTSDTFETAVRYHFYHVFALLALGLIHNQMTLNKVMPCFWLFFTGIILFSGSLYALCLTNISVLGAVTPVGGVLLVSAWIWLAVAVSQRCCHSSPNDQQ